MCEKGGGGQNRECYHYAWYAYTRLVDFPEDVTKGFYFVIGVLLGLFICSLPAANMLDLLFAARRSQSSSSEWALLGRLGLDLLVLFAGWIVVTIGATRLIA